MQQIISQLILLLYLIFGNGIVLVQGQSDLCNYTLSNTAIPYSAKDYSTKSVKLVQELNAVLTTDLGNLNADPRKDYKIAYEEGTKYLTELIENDFFLFDENLEAMVQKLVDKIEAANEISHGEKMRFLICRTGIPNAFTMRDGTIVLNLGLLSRLHNWNQLAFILCHEIAHHHEDHVNERIAEQITLFNSPQFKKKLKAAKKGKELANQELLNLLKDSGLSYAKHSRDAELETDALGFEFYKKAGFPIEQAYSALEMLWDLDFPKYELPALDSFFNFPEIPWKEEWAESHLSGLSLVELSDEEKEKFRTHPQVEERLDQIEDLGAKQNEQQSFLLCDLSLQFDLEILEHYYEDDNAFQAFILGLQLSNINPNNNFVQHTIANCLLDFSIARADHKFSNYVPLPGRRLTTQENKIATILDNLRLSELNALSKAYINKNIDLKDSSKAISAIEEKLKKLED